MFRHTSWGVLGALGVLAVVLVGCAPSAMTPTSAPTPIPTARSPYFTPDEAIALVQDKLKTWTYTTTRYGEPVRGFGGLATTVVIQCEVWPEAPWANWTAVYADGEWAVTRAIFWAEFKRQNPEWANTGYRFREGFEVAEWTLNERTRIVTPRAHVTQWCRP